VRRFEVGDIPMPMQVSLLRVLQEGEIERLGGKEAVKVDVRLLAATHKDLKKLVADGLFREDLYYRLNVIALNVPPLRERQGDVTLLATAFLKRFCDKHKKSIEGFDVDCLNALEQWRYPGNVRELENAIERAVVLCQERELRVGDLPEDMRKKVAPLVRVNEVRFRAGETTMEQLEHQAINATMAHTGGDKTRAAKLLGISIRTLYRRLDRDGAVGE